VGQVDVVAHRVGRDDLVGGEVTLDRGPSGHPEREEARVAGAGQHEHAARGGEAELDGQRGRLDVRRDRAVHQCPDGDQERRVGREQADRPDPGRVVQEGVVRPDADQPAEPAAGQEVHQGAESDDDGGVHRDVRAGGVQGHGARR
jgi:hypothetical protein